MTSAYLPRERPRYEVANGDIQVEVDGGVEGAPVVQWLLEHGARVDGTRDSYASPLAIAAGQGDMAALRALLDHGADVSRRSSETGETPLHAAARAFYPEVVRTLLAAGAATDARDAAGRTPLHSLFVNYEPWENEAGDGDIREIVRALVQHGAEVGAVDADGETPADIARANGVKDDILALLEPRRRNP